ncbi:hypothetical protein AGDE_12912 [Angomonas deanei]|uniref:ABC transporter, putative n=1 Tax=Angomonas deanei TaxID=59799 RepID=A0A7G2C2I0_9TRYP|nr:hypothetical protein AGDE_12912 [Angomonas deanei]CAD2213454.1 ABC transporter, putative [Angomonas deanei]|eukprot:EPY23295.1 hypothetical protein AGDE_12912 [Angomonas deanei]
MRVMVGNLINLSNAKLLVALLGLSSLERCLTQLLPQPRSPFVLMEKGSGVGFAQCAKGICAFYATAALTQVLFSLIAGEKKWVASRVSYAYKLAVVRDTTLRLCECPYDHPRVDHFHTKIMHIMFACSNLDIGALEGYVDYYWSLVSKARVVLELPVEYVVSRFARQFTRTRERAMRHTELLVHALEDSANETKAAIEPVHYGLLLLLCAAHGHDASPWPSLSRLALYTGCPVESATCLKLYGALCRSITECGPFTEAEQQWLAAMHQEAMRVLQTDTRVARNERNAFYRKLSVDERRDLLLSDDTVSPPDPTPLPRPPLSVRQWKAALLSSFGVFATAFLGSLPFYATLLSLSRRRTTLGDSIAETEETNAKLATLCANHGHAVEVDDLYRTPTLFSLAYSETLSTVKNDTMWMNFGLQVIREFSHAEFPPAALHPPPAPWRIRFERVSFRYPRATSPALDDVSFEVIGGQFCGIVGFNGSGKSTIFKLLTRLYEPQSGTIYLNGIPLRDFSRRELNRSAASAWYSTNEMRFLPLSLEENIGLGNIAATGEEVRAALDHVEGGALAGRSGNAVFHAEHFSSGEVEKLNLSRVFVKPGAPSVGLYLLDEATRSLDSVTEEKVLRRIRDFRSTFILITHRLSTLKEADTILVFRSGKLVESGSWTSLTRKGVHTYFQQLLH